MTRVEKATAYHEAGFNCAQSVFAACADLADVPEQQALVLGGGFGGGFGCGEVCGAICGGVMALGGILPFCDGSDKDRKKLVKEAAKTLCRRFQAEFGHLDCRDLLKSTAPKERCGDYIAWTAKAVEEIAAEFMENK